jgi:hypothetical protein
MKWMQTRKIPLQTPMYSSRVSYCRYNKGGKCTHTISLQNPSPSKVSYYNIKKGKYTHKVSQNLNTPTHKAFKNKEKGKQIHIKLTYKQSFATLKC